MREGTGMRPLFLVPVVDTIEKNKHTWSTNDEISTTDKP